MAPTRRTNTSNTDSSGSTFEPTQRQVQLSAQRKTRSSAASSTPAGPSSTPAGPGNTPAASNASASGGTPGASATPSGAAGKQPMSGKRKASPLVVVGASGATASGAGKTHSGDADEDSTIPVDDMNEDDPQGKHTKSRWTLPVEPSWETLSRRADKGSYDELLEVALDYANETGQRVARDLSNDPDAWFDLGNVTLCSMNRRVVRHLIRGNVAWLEKTQDDLFHGLSHNLKERDSRTVELKYLKGVGVQGRVQPCIYVRTLSTAGQRLPPTIGEVRRVLKDLQEYASVARTADERHYLIDSMYDPEWELDFSKEGRRKYLDPSPTFRRKVLRIFCTALENNLSGKKDSDEFNPSFHYIGYALHADHRKMQHDRTGSESTSWLSSLVLCMFQYHFKAKNYKMHFNVICLIGEEAQAAIAEILLCIIGHGSFWTGLGFNIAFCGMVSSVRMPKKTSAERKALWYDWQNYILDHTPFQANMKLNNVLFREYRKRQRLAPAKELEQHGERVYKSVSDFHDAMEEARAYGFGDEAVPDPVYSPGHVERVLELEEDIEYREKDRRGRSESL